MKTYIKDGRKYTTASRWIKVNFEIVTPRHSLYEYGDGCGLDPSETAKNLREIISFRHDGRKYALNQFERLSYPIMLEDADGIQAIIGGYDSTQFWHPYLIEIHPGGDYIRLWNENNLEV